MQSHLPDSTHKVSLSSNTTAVTVPEKEKEKTPDEGLKDLRETAYTSMFSPKGLRKFASETHLLASPSVQFRAAYYLDYGVEGVTENHVEAFNWYNKAAEKKYAPALYFLSIRYMFNGDFKTANSYTAAALKRSDDEPDTLFATAWCNYEFAITVIEKPDEDSNTIKDNLLAAYEMFTKLATRFNHDKSYYMLHKIHQNSKILNLLPQSLQKKDAKEYLSRTGKCNEGDFELDKLGLEFIALSEKSLRDSFPVKVSSLLPALEKARFKPYYLWMINMPSS